MVPTRRVEDQIRKLCDRAANAEGEQLEAIVAELQVRIHEGRDCSRPEVESQWRAGDARLSKVSPLLHP